MLQNKTLGEEGEYPSNHRLYGRSQVLPANLSTCPAGVAGHRTGITSWIRAKRAEGTPKTAATKYNSTVNLIVRLEKSASSYE
jgi:hypothetical protein